VEVNRSGVTSISPAVEMRGRHKKLKEGLANEIRNVKTGRGDVHMWIDAVWYRELTKFWAGIWKVMKGFGRLLWQGRLRYARHSHQNHGAASDTGGMEGRSHAEGDDYGGDDTYERFLRGENVSDDDDEEYEPHPMSQALSRTPSTFSEVASDDEATGDTASETAALFTDLSSAASTSASAPLLLAHMTDASSTPLTRRRYRDLVHGPSDPPPESNAWATFGVQSVADDGAVAENRRNCVICTVEARQVICWPCRCLAMCDDCRENLASRSSASKHRCPCCRRNVEGYSRIFIP